MHFILISPSGIYKMLEGAGSDKNKQLYHSLFFTPMKNTHKM